MRRPLARLGRAGHAVAATAAAAAVLGVLGFGYGTLPALGPALDPARGAWTSAAGGVLPHSQMLHLTGLVHPATVAFTSRGVPSIRAGSMHDVSLALGYVQASFRLSEMDLERRLGEGRLAALAGPADVGSDEFELRLGLARTAAREWAATPRSSPAGQALTGFAQGVNDYLAQVRGSGDWPALFGLTGVYPARWTPVDSLVIQGVLTQELDFTTTPLDYALLDRSLGPARTMAWFPVQEPGEQSPYDPGPYRKLPLASLDTSGRAVATGAMAAGDGGAGGGGMGAGGGDMGGGKAGADGAGSGGGGAGGGLVTAGTARAAAALLSTTDALPAGRIHRDPDSNAWAADGPAVAGGGALLAGDPHLPQTMPSLWYQVALAAPGYTVSGVSVPGLPGILIGHNTHIAWSLTDTQNQSALFYTERTQASRPHEYYWRGAWRKMRLLHYAIAVRGGATRRITVEVTVHGPVLTQAGQTVAVDWMGAIPSPDLAAMLGVSEASDFAQFRAALANWRAPTQNFVYADTRGNIGAISAGYYPEVRRGDPWLPLPGTGADDVAGVIPYAAVPQVYDPPGHVVATANQRPVGPSYPYYIGTSANFFDPGYRANEIYGYLRGRTGLTTASFATLQTSVTDQLASQVVPRLRAALAGARLTGTQAAAARLLDGWSGAMKESSPAASLWWTFWSDYVPAVFQPWWTAAAVQTREDRPGLTAGIGLPSLDALLAAWTQHDPGNPAFTRPGAHPGSGTAVTAMRAAFVQAVAHLTSQLGPVPGRWAWGRLHRREFPSLTQADALGYGPRPASGDPWTVDAAEGGLTSSVGPSWRMIVRLGPATTGAGATGAGTVSAEGVYPGGQSENPASPWYADLISTWWDGHYLPMPPAGGSPPARSPRGAVRWTLRP